MLAVIPYLSASLCSGCCSGFDEPPAVAAAPPAVLLPSGAHELPAQRKEFDLCFSRQFSACCEVY